MAASGPGIFSHRQLVRRVDAEELHGGSLTFQCVRSPVDESGRSSSQTVDRLASEKDRITGGLSQLLDAGSDIERIADQGELQLAAAADGARDHPTGVDADADPK